MAWTLEQSVTDFSTPTHPAKGTGYADAFDSSVTTGSLLVCVALARPTSFSGTAPVLTVTDDVGSKTWTEVGQKGSDNHTVGVWWRLAESGETTAATRVTATYSSSSVAQWRIALYEYSSSVGGTITLEDSSAFGTDSTVTSVSAGSLSVADGDLVFGAGTIRRAGTDGPMSASSPMVLLDGDLDNESMCGASGDSRPTTTTTIDPTFTISSAGASAGAVGGVFRDTSASTVPANLRLDTTQGGGDGKTQTSIHLIWDAVTGASGYDIERNGTVIAADNAGVTYEDSGLTAAVEYTHRVRAVF